MYNPLLRLACGTLVIYGAEYIELSLASNVHMEMM